MRFFQIIELRTQRPDELQRRNSDLPETAETADRMAELSAGPPVGVFAEEDL